MGLPKLHMDSTGYGIFREYRDQCCKGPLAAANSAASKVCCMRVPFATH